MRVRELQNIGEGGEVYLNDTKLWDQPEKAARSWAGSPGRIVRVEKLGPKRTVVSWPASEYDRSSGWVRERIDEQGRLHKEVPNVYLRTDGKTGQELMRRYELAVASKEAALQKAADARWWFSSAGLAPANSFGDDVVFDAATASKIIDRLKRLAELEGTKTR